jgi:hypothetical protein
MSGRRGSEKRQRSVIIQSRIAPGERATLQAKAEATGVSISELIRYAVLNYRPPPAKIDRQTVNLLLGELGKNRVEVSKAGSNLNQIAYHLNAGRPGDIMDGRIEAGLAEFSQAIRTFEELRLACLQALGLERDRKPPRT